MQTNQRIKDIREMENLIKELNQASDAYYNQDKELISNFVYDQLYDRLVDLRKEIWNHSCWKPDAECGISCSVRT